MNVRVWKANASEQLGTVLPRERKAQQYSKALIERHKHLPGAWAARGAGRWVRAARCCRRGGAGAGRAALGATHDSPTRTPSHETGRQHRCILRPTPRALPPHPAADVARIVRQRHLPAAIYKASKLRRTQMDSERRKTQHRVAHSAPGSVQLKPARKKKIVAELE